MGVSLNHRKQWILFSLLVYAIAWVQTLSATPGSIITTIDWINSYAICSRIILDQAGCKTSTGASDNCIWHSGALATKYGSANIYQVVEIEYSKDASGHCTATSENLLNAESIFTEIGTISTNELCSSAIQKYSGCGGLSPACVSLPSRLGFSANSGQVAQVIFRKDAQGNCTALNAVIAASQAQSITASSVAVNDWAVCSANIASQANCGGQNSSCIWNFPQPAALASKYDGNSAVQGASLNVSYFQDPYFQDCIALDEMSPCQVGLTSCPGSGTSTGVVEEFANSSSADANACLNEVGSVFSANQQACAVPGVPGSGPAVTATYTAASGQAQSATVDTHSCPVGQVYDSGSCVLNQPFNPASWGMNLTDSLVNPMEANFTSAELTQEVARILHDVRMAGGTSVRWFVDTVWSQYECSRDPENQATGEIDPGWYMIADTLLREAELLNIKVDITLADLAANGFVETSNASIPPPPLVSASVAAASWEAYRISQKGKDHYTDNHLCTNAFQNGYYGYTTTNDILTYDIPQLQRRFLTMANFLQNYPALGSLDFFNEPSLPMGKSGEAKAAATFAAGVASIRNYLYRSNPSLRSIPIYSGIAWWDSTIGNALASSGDFTYEPYVVLHDYRDYTQANADSSRAAVAATWKWVENSVTAGGATLGASGKPLLFEELGSDVTLSSPADHAAMTAFWINRIRLANGFGAWPWGTWFDDSSTDYKWTANVRSRVGGSYRPFFINTDKEQLYATAQNVQVYDHLAQTLTPTPVSLSQASVSDPNPIRQLKYLLQFGNTVYRSTDRDGIFNEKFAANPELFGNPAESILFNETSGQAVQWAELIRNGNGYILNLYSCSSDSPGAGIAGQPTPPYVLQLENIEFASSRTDFNACNYSILLQSAPL